MLSFALPSVVETKLAEFNNPVAVSLANIAFSKLIVSSTTLKSFIVSLFVVAFKVVSKTKLSLPAPPTNMSFPNLPFSISFPL